MIGGMVVEIETSIQIRKVFRNQNQQESVLILDVLNLDIEEGKHHGKLLDF